MDKDQDFIRLLSVFGEYIEANKDEPAGEDDYILDTEGLAAKCLLK
jgi:hypothetical protein